MKGVRYHLLECCAYKKALKVGRFRIESGELGSVRSIMFGLIVTIITGLTISFAVSSCFSSHLRSLICMLWSKAVSEWVPARESEYYSKSTCGSHVRLMQMPVQLEFYLLHVQRRRADRAPKHDCVTFRYELP